MSKQVKQTKKKSGKSSVKSKKKSPSKSNSAKNGQRKITRQKKKSSKKKSHFPIAAFLGILSFVFVIQAILFFSRFSQTDEINDEYVQQISGNAIPFQYLLFGLVGLTGFYFAWRIVKQAKRIIALDWAVLALVFVTAASIYAYAFNKRISINGDNAEYVIVAKSLVERGAAYRLETRNETRNSLSSVGLPVLLAPIYAIWGLDLVKMKSLITLVAILLFPVLFFLFRKEQDYWTSALLAATAISSAYLVSSSTTIMTEIPFMFWSALGLLAIVHYKDRPTFKWYWAIVSILLLIMAYFTRAVGMAAFAALGIYLFIHVPWKKLLFPFNFKRIIKNVDFQKLFFLFAPLFLFALAYQIRQQINGVSQASIFFKEDMWSYFSKNALSGMQVMAQMLFSSDAFKWVSFSSAYTLPTLNIGWMFLDAIILIGMIRLIARKSVIGIYGLIMMFIIFFGSLDPSQMVSIRYLSVISPFLIYYFWMGSSWIFDLLANRLNNAFVAKFGKVVCVLLLIQIMFISQICNSFTILRSYVGFGPGYDNFINTLNWCEAELPEDAFVMSIKPRITYIYTEMKGTRVTNTNEEYSAEYEQRKLNSIRELEVSHIIVDDLSGSTRRNIVPIIQNNPDKFEQIFTTGGGRATSVYKVL